MKYEFTPAMDEISGFGGGYEATCRRMLRQALEWCDANPKAAKRLTYKTFANIYGIYEAENREARALDSAMTRGTDETGGVTGAMHQAVVSHVLWIMGHSWDSYIRVMSTRKSR